MRLRERLPFYDTLVLPYHKAQGVAASVKNGFPARKMTVIGVTGTNGKTTTCFMIYKMLLEAGRKVGLMTTVAYGVGEDIHEQVHHMTTVSAGLLNQRMKEIADAGAEYLVLEVTSHALAQYRITGVPIDIAVMTNVTHEHLDYHRTFERYRDAKRKLFKLANRNRAGRAIGVINADDASAKFFKKDILRPITYGVDHGDWRATQVKVGTQGVEYWLKNGKEKLHIRTKLAGQFNVYNSMAAAVVGLNLGLTEKEVEKGLWALATVEGRMARIDEGQDFEVIVDYAHTPDAFKVLFEALPKPKNGRVIVMFGSAGGRRDPSKRAPQGEIAGEHADVVILTEEDDRDTPNEEILNQIAAGAERSGRVRAKKVPKNGEAANLAVENGENLFLVARRPEAIRLAIGMAKKGDLVLLLGKGHEKTMEGAEGEKPYYEPDEARKALRARLNRLRR
ncbi:MAG: UDP-N-acetylmuramyl-tripeptide synthetase [Candidatus Nomurabacteria bacterium]|jgi:UDP-N-acetylmuramoyl-L-alanyl-D-glutamate--2,6-diaminopimelate ligase|nr:UDP-N-acetylmuramyl-tripeptide synthetase [Candidatus Nomurabacteria bacterium]